MPRKRLKVETTEAMRERGRKPGRKGKYNASGSREDGHWFCSAAELHRYRQLRLMQESGLIQNLELQPPFPLIVNGQKIGRYVADFRYAALDELGRITGVIVEDVKGFITDVYVIKRKLVAALYGIAIKEIPANKVGQFVDRVPD